MKNIAITSFSKEEQDVAKSLLNSINFNGNYNDLTHFLTQVEQKVLQTIVAYNYSNIRLEFFGGSSDAERCRAKLMVNDFYDIPYEIVCLRARFNAKFHNIRHKDVMGAIHNLGINYNRIGDIIVKDDSVYIFVASEIADYVVMNFSRIGRAVLDFEIVTELENLNVEKEYESFEIVCSSHRIDSIVSKITNKSRSITKEMLQKELVKLNHSVVTNAEKNCVVGDLISIRKYGRFIIKASRQNTKSLKYRITVDKLV